MTLGIFVVAYDVHGILPFRTKETWHLTNREVRCPRELDNAYLSAFAAEGSTQQTSFQPRGLNQNPLRAPVKPQSATQYVPDV